MSASSLNSAALLTAWEEGVTQPPVRRALALLAAAWPEKSEDQWSRVSIGERDGHLLRLRETLFGPSLEATAICPQCGQRLEMTFDTDDVRIPSPSRPASQEGLCVKVSGYEVTCHSPTSADLMAIADDRAADGHVLIMERCIEMARLDGKETDPSSLPAEVVRAVDERLANGDPQAEVQIAMSCLACSHQWSLPFDILTYLWGDIGDWAQRLLAEIHTLASAYGWSEREIVAMTERRRRFYVEMVGA
jgi:hypothetical protein